MQKIRLLHLFILEFKNSITWLVESILVNISRTRFFHYMMYFIYESPLDKLRINKFVKKIYFFYFPLLPLPHTGQPPNNPHPPLPSPRTTKGQWWTDSILKSRLINTFKVISFTGNALEYSKTFAFISKFFIIMTKLVKNSEIMFKIYWDWMINYVL